MASHVGSARPVESSGDLFLMSPPGPGWQLRGRANFRSDAADHVDATNAFAEWLSLARAIQAAGGHVVALPADDALTGLPYAAEAGHPLPPTRSVDKPRFVLPRMWAPHRTGEARLWGPFAEAMGFQLVTLSSGCWEGQGDVASFRGTELLFFGGRSDRAGLDQVRGLFSQDALVLECRQPAFHGNVAALPIDACDRIVVCPELLVGDSMALLEERFGKDALLRISEAEARAYCTNSLPVGKTLIAPSVASPRVLDALRELGMEIVELSMKELCEKAGGASRCLVCRVPAGIAAVLSHVVATDLDWLSAQRRGG